MTRLYIYIYTVYTQLMRWSIRISFRCWMGYGYLRGQSYCIWKAGFECLETMSDATFPCVEMICVLDRPDQKRCPSWGEEQFMAEPVAAVPSVLMIMLVLVTIILMIMLSIVMMMMMLLLLLLLCCCGGTGAGGSKVAEFSGFHFFLVGRLDKT